MIFRRLSYALFFCLFLFACNGVPLTTLWKMRKIDPLSVDPAQVRIAIRGPAWLTPKFADMKLLVRMDIWNRNPLFYVFRLNQIDASSESTALSRAGLSLDGLSFLEIDPSEIVALREAQANINEFKKAGYQGGTSVGLWNRDLSGCSDFKPPEGPILMDVYVHLSDESGWMTFFEKQDFRDKIGNNLMAMACETDSSPAPAEPRAALSAKSLKSRAKEFRGGVSYQFAK